MKTIKLSKEALTKRELDLKNRKNLYNEVLNDPDALPSDIACITAQMANLEILEAQLNKLKQ